MSDRKGAALTGPGDGKRAPGPRFKDVREYVGGAQEQVPGHFGFNSAEASNPGNAKRAVGAVELWESSRLHLRLARCFMVEAVDIPADLAALVDGNPPSPEKDRQEQWGCAEFLSGMLEIEG